MSIWTFLGGLLGAVSQLAHFVCHHRETAPMFTGTSRFDGGVQGQQIGLIGYRADDLDDAIDLPRVIGQAQHHRIAGLHLLGQLANAGLRFVDRQDARSRIAIGFASVPCGPARPAGG